MQFGIEDIFDWCKSVVKFDFYFKSLSFGEKATTILFFPVTYPIIFLLFIVMGLIIWLKKLKK